MQITIIQVVPFAGTPVAFCLFRCAPACPVARVPHAGTITLSLTYSFYAFEYVWALEGVALTDRIRKMEEQWCRAVLSHACATGV